MKEIRLDICVLQFTLCYKITHFRNGEQKLNLHSRWQPWSCLALDWFARRRKSQASRTGVVTAIKQLSFPFLEAGDF